MKCGILWVTYEGETIKEISYSISEFLKPERLCFTMFLAEPFVAVLAHIEAAMRNNIESLATAHDQTTLS